MAWEDSNDFVIWMSFFSKIIISKQTRQSGKQVIKKAKVFKMRLNILCFNTGYLHWTGWNKKKKKSFSKLK